MAHASSPCVSPRQYCQHRFAAVAAAVNELFNAFTPFHCETMDISSDRFGYGHEILETDSERKDVNLVNNLPATDGDMSPSSSMIKPSKRHHM